MVDPHCRMLKKASLLTCPTPTRRDAPFPKEGRNSAVDPRFTVPGSDARTPLAGFFSILLRCELQDPKGYARWRPRQTSNG